MYYNDTVYQFENPCLSEKINVSIIFASDQLILPTIVMYLFFLLIFFHNMMIFKINDPMIFYDFMINKYRVYYSI